MFQKVKYRWLKNMKKCSTSLDHNEILSHSVQMTSIGKQTERNAGDDADNKEPLSTAGGNTS